MPPFLKFFLLGVLLIPCWVIAYHGVGDIGMYYSVSQYAKAFEFDRIYGSNVGVGHFFYGPLSLLTFSWMPSFSLASVRWIWIGLNTFFYVLFWWGLHELYPFLKKRETSWLWFLVWVVSIKSIHASFQSHNVQLIIASVILLGEVARLRKERGLRFLSYVPVVFAAEIKVFPAFMCVWAMVRGERYVRMGIILASLVGGLLPLFYFGPSNGINLYTVFASNLGNFHDYAPLTKDAVTLSLASLVATWVSPLLGMEGALLLNKVLSTGIGVAFMISVWKLRKVEEGRLRTHIFALGMSLMALLNSTTRPDYFIFFVPAFTSLAELWKERRLGLWHIVGLFLSAFLIVGISEWTLGSRELGHRLELYRLPVVGMMVLCVTHFLALRARQGYVFLRKNKLNVLFP